MVILCSNFAQTELKGIEKFHSKIGKAVSTEINQFGLIRN